MAEGMSLYALAATVIVGAAAVYWAGAGRRRALAAGMPGAAVHFVAGGLGLAFCLWSVYLERPAPSYERRAEPLAIAIAFDLSPSMLAIPDPEVAPQALPRYLRGREALLDMLRGLEERNEAALVSIIGFTTSADVIMGWNRNVAQAGEVILHTMSPEIFGSSGTSMEAAVSAITDVFNMLPATFGTARRLAIVVSDGEDTMREASFGYAVDIVSRAGFDVIALQTGSLDEHEGVPTYNRAGEFTGFERIGGQLYTRPDAGAMEALAMVDEVRSLYLRAEAPDASRRMLDFAYGGAAGTGAFDVSLLPLLGMFGAVLVLLGWTLR